MYRYDRVHGLKQMNLFINRLLSLIKLLFHDIISIIMKYRCIVCKKEFVDGHTICHDCWSEMYLISDPKCKKCGYPFEFYVEGEMLCGRCLAGNVFYDKMISVCSYDGVAKSIIRGIKYSDSIVNAKVMAKMMIPIFKSVCEDVDCVTCVPVHRLSLLKRMFNQSGIIGNSITKQLKMRNIFNPYLLKKIKITKKQSSLSLKQRSLNLKNAFKVRGIYIGKIKNAKKIIIIDDVITTGATINECAKAIKKINKNCQVIAVSFARTLLQ